MHEVPERSGEVMKLIKISTDLELTVHEFPSGGYAEENRFLRELIGNDCRIYEHIMPSRLYTVLHMKKTPDKSAGAVYKYAD